MATNLDDPETIECWCGATGTYEELFDASGVSPASPPENPKTRKSWQY